MPGPCSRCTVVKERKCPSALFWIHTEKLSLEQMNMCTKPREEGANWRKAHPASYCAVLKAARKEQPRKLPQKRQQARL